MKNKIEQYLIGNNEHLLGTILGFSRNRSNTIFRNESIFSFLIFFDHRTGRFEIFLKFGFQRKVKIFII